MEHKRISVRLVEELAVELISIAQQRGLSVNALISEIAWNFVEKWDWANKQKKEG